MVLEKAVACRMLHRVMQHQTDTEYAEKTFINGNKFVNDLAITLKSALRLVRRLLGAPGDTKIMLAVDELSKAGDTDMAFKYIPDMTTGLVKTHQTASEGFTPALMMSNLCGAMDSDPSLYLSISAYGCVQRMTTGSNRPLLLQPLPPILPLYGNSFDRISLLPFVLRPFFVEEMRLELPSTADDLSVYSRISDLFHIAGAHPRRLECLLDELSRTNAIFEFVLRGLDKNSAKDFADKLKGWLDEQKKNDIIDIVNVRCEFSDDLMNLSDVYLRQLAEDVTVPFKFPNSVKSAEKHSAMLYGTLEGFCSYLPKSPDSKKGFAYIPPPVLDQIMDRKYNEPKANTLANLGNALSKYRTRETQGSTSLTAQTKAETKTMTKAAQVGKALEQVALQALLLHARCNEDFSPGALCVESQCGSGLGLTLKGGASVEVWNEIKLFPYAGKDPPKDEQKRLVRQLLFEHVSKLEAKPECSGALFQPSDEKNKGGDVYGLFRSVSSDEYVLLVVQCKDWFNKPRNNVTLERRFSGKLKKDWGKSKKVFPDPVIQLSREDTGTRDIVVRVVHLLVTSNEVPEMWGAIEDNTGIITFQSMRSWNPTAAYALECASGLRKLYSEFPKTMPASEEGVEPYSD